MSMPALTRDPSPPVGASSPAGGDADPEATPSARFHALARLADSRTRLNLQRLERARTRERGIAVAFGCCGVAGAGLACWLGSFVLMGTATQQASAVLALLLALAPALLALRIGLRDPDRSPLAGHDRRTARLATLATVIHTLGQRADATHAVDLEAILDTLRDEIDEPQGGGEAAPASLRRHRRVTPREDRTIVRTADGRRQIARILNVSVSGVAIETELKDVPVGQAVVVGSRSARAVRKLPRGMAFVFDVPLDPATLSVDIVL